MGQPYLRYYSAEEPKAGAGGSTTQMKLIESYEATSAESTKTFTFTAIDFSTIAYLLIEIDLATTLQLELRMQLDGLTTKYYQEGRIIVDGTETITDDSNQAHAILARTTQLTAVNKIFSGIITIKLSKGATAQRTHYHIEAHADKHSIQIHGRQITSITDIESIKIFTSTSTWKIGARMSLYEIQR